MARTRCRAKSMKKYEPNLLGFVRFLEDQGHTATSRMGPLHAEGDQLVVGRPRRRRQQRFR